MLVKGANGRQVPGWYFILNTMALATQGHGIEYTLGGGGGGGGGEKCAVGHEKWE